MLLAYRPRRRCPMSRNCRARLLLAVLFLVAATVLGHTGPVRAVAFAPDGKTLASGSADQTIRLWDPATGKLIRQLAAQEPIVSLAISPDSQTLVAGTAYGSVRVFGVAKGLELRVI